MNTQLKSQKILSNTYQCQLKHSLSFCHWCDYDDGGGGGCDDGNDLEKAICYTNSADQM